MLRMRPFLAILLGLALHPTLYSQSAPSLGIYGVVTKSGTEQNYESILRQTAEMCPRVGCPYSYLVFQSLANSEETWIVSIFASTEEQYKFDEYLRHSNLPISKRRMAVRMSYSWHGNSFRPDLSHGTQWKMGQDQLLIVTRTKNPPSGQGTVFQAGLEFILFAPAPSDADAVAAASNPDPFIKSNVFVAVLRPELSVPAKEWMDADPDLWVRHTSAKDIRPVIDYDPTSQ